MRRGFTIADLKADGKKAGVQKVIDDRCEVWKKIVKTMGALSPVNHKGLYQN